jgi:hypothetical protein
MLTHRSGRRSLAHAGMRGAAHEPRQIATVGVVRRRSRRAAAGDVPARLRLELPGVPKGLPAAGGGGLPPVGGGHAGAYIMHMSAQPP